MLVLYIFILMFTNSINHLQKNIHSIYINRITIITLLISILYTFNTLYFQSIGKGISLYNGLYQSTVQSHLVEILLIIVGISILLSWPYLLLSPFDAGTNLKAEDEIYPMAGEQQSKSSASKGLLRIPYLASWVENPARRPSFLNNKGAGKVIKYKVESISKSDQYSLIAIFSILGGSLLMSSLDLLSMYLSIELQSFALYILATLNKDKLSATSAGLKYFLLGSLSSCFILLGSAIIYSYTGLTQFEAINTLLSVPFFNDMADFTSARLNQANIASLPLSFGLFREGSVLIEMLDIHKAFTIGLIIILIGFLFKISAAPFYQWAPDVYDGTPTIVTVWLTIVVKLTILIFLLGLIELSTPDTVSLINNNVGSGPALISQESGYTTIVAAPSILETVPGIAISSPSPNWAGCFGFAEGGTEISAKSPLSQILMPLNKVGWEVGSVQIKNLLLISSLFSLLVGTIAGLSQIKVKRLLAFSSISHVGFLLLALGIYTQKSVDSFIFYLIQYTITSLNIFLILLAFGYLLYSSCANSLNVNAIEERDTSAGGQQKTDINTSVDQGTSVCGLWFQHKQLVLPVPMGRDINYLIELKGQLHKNPVLSISFAICLFSMAGIPPLIGFFSKQFVLFSSIENGNNFLSIVAILVSVISASYYLKLIKITFFSIVPSGKTRRRPENNSALGLALKPGEVKLYLSNIHSYLIAILTFLILFFFLDPSILLNGTQLISLTIFNL